MASELIDLLVFLNLISQQEQQTLETLIKREDSPEDQIAR